MIIAELSQNHNGDVNLLLDLTKSAIDAGANAVKIQTFFAADLSEGWKSEWDRIKKLELDWEAHQKFFDLCTQDKVIPMTSVYSKKYLPYLHGIGFKYIKIGSAQATDKELILTYLSTGFSVIVSTGGHTVQELPKLGPLAGILHCVSLYPHPWHDANMNRIFELRKWWANTPYGLSDHSDPTDPIHWCDASKVAMAMGSTWIERHYTMLPRDQTKDGPVSVDYDQLKILCQLDALSFEEKIKMLPESSYHCPQMQEELDNIKKYETRWIKD